MLLTVFDMRHPTESGLTFLSTRPRVLTKTSCVNLAGTSVQANSDP